MRRWLMPWLLGATLLGVTTGGLGAPPTALSDTQVKPKAVTGIKANTQTLVAATASAGTVLKGVIGATMQTCKGAPGVLAAGATQPLTCNVTSPLGGSKMLVLPEMYVPGNGCIVADSKPRVVMVGNNFGVTTTLRNRCATGFPMSEGGLGWVILELGDNAGQTAKFTGIASGTLQKCAGSAATLAPNATQTLTCDVVSSLGGSQMLVLPEMYVPGNGCIVADSAPRVVMVGNNFGVTTTLRNRCGSTMSMKEGGIGWLVLQIGSGTNQTLSLAGVVDGNAQTCAGPASALAAGASANLTCNVTSPLGGSKMLITPEMYVPGNGCIVSSVKPHVVMVGNNLGVNTTLANRCGSSFNQSEGGLGWLIWQLSGS
jgi:hypothetical protein